MKKILLIATTCAVALTLASCSCNSGSQNKTTGAPAYTVLEKPQVDLSALTVDADGYYVLFNGTDLTGWRTYGKDEPTERWTVEDGAIKFNGSGTGEALSLSGGDLLFAHKFKNFEFECEWKVAKGSNSGILYLAQEVTTEKEDGTTKLEPIYISAPEYQILDNANHPDAKLGVDGNRQSASLYDMIPAKPQNFTAYDEWNKAKILVYKGTVVHSQNDENVLEYHLWTDQWNDLLQDSKFSEEKWPLAYELLSNCGGDDHEGYIAFQDHGDDVWYRNIRIKVLDD